MASINMFEQGLFSSDPQDPHRVDGTLFMLRAAHMSIYSLFLASGWPIPYHARAHCLGYAGQFDQPDGRSRRTLVIAGQSGGCPALKPILLRGLR